MITTALRLYIMEGTEVNWEYKVDMVNLDEKLLLYGNVIISSKLPDLNERFDMDCPVCGCDAGHIDDLEAEVDGVHVSLIHYACSECGREFYVSNTVPYPSPA